MATRTLTVVFAGDTKALDNAVKSVGGKLEEAESKTSGTASRMGSSLAKIGAGFVAGFAADKGVEFIKGAITAASDLQETISKTEQIFGDASKPLIAWSKTTAKSLGQSQQQALDAASTFGTFGSAAGLTGKELAAFSGGLVGLASDMASFGNTTPQQAIDALGAGLRGESEPLRAYGVLLDDASLKAEAMTLGLMKPVVNQAKITAAQVAITAAQKAVNDATHKYGANSLEAQKAQASLGTAQDTLAKSMEGVTEALTPQQKVLASNSLIFKQTGKAQDDFSKTSDGLANKTRIMQAQFADFKTAVGEKLLPILMSAVNSLDDVGKAFGNVTRFIKDNILVIGTVTVAIGAMVLVANAGAIAYALFGLAINAWSLVTRVATAVAAAFNAVMNANPISLIIIAIIALVAIIVILYQKNEAVRNIIQSAWEIIQNVISAAWAVIKVIFGAIMFVIGLVIDYFQLWWKIAVFVFDAIVEAAQALWGAFKAVVGWIMGAVDGMVSFFRQLPGRIVAVLSNMWQFLVDGFNNAKNGVISLVENFITTLTGIPGRVGTALSGIWDGITSGAKGAVNGAIGILNTLIHAFNKVIEGYNKIPLAPNIPTIPDIPKLAAGGIVTRPTYALIGEAGPEAVIPLGRGMGMSGGNTYITINVPESSNPVEVGRIINNHLRAFRRASGVTT